MTPDKFMETYGSNTTVGVFELNNANLVDRTFSQSANTISSYVQSCNRMATPASITLDPIPAVVPSGPQIAIYGSGNVGVSDLLVPIRFNFASTFGVFPNGIPIIGYIVKQSFTSNAVSNAFELSLVHNVVDGVDGGPPTPPVTSSTLSRTISVTPTGGGNSTSEYLIAPTQPAYIGTYSAGSSSISSPSVQSLSVLTPLTMSSNPSAAAVSLGQLASVGLILKNQAGVSQQTSVTPILGTRAGVNALVATLASARSWKK